VGRAIGRQSLRSLRLTKYRRDWHVVTFDLCCSRLGFSDTTLNITGTADELYASFLRVDFVLSPDIDRREHQ